MLVKNATHNHKPLKMLEVGDLCYRREFDGKKPVKIENMCKAIKIRKRGELYYIRDLETERIYLRNCSWIDPSNSSSNEINKARNLKVICDKSSYQQIDNNTLSIS